VKKIRLSIFLVVSLLCNLAYGQTATLHYDSEPGDYIGQGETRTYTEADGTFTIFRNYDNGVNVNFQNEEWWNLNFAAPYEAELSVSFYPNAQRWPFQDIDKPGLDFSGDGRGCNTLTGEFTISKMIYDFFGVPRRFSATLEQHCEDAPPALYGSIDYDFGGIGPASLTTGNILVTLQYLLLEYSPDGTLVQRIPILRDGDASPDLTEDVRDVVVSNEGHVYIFNGTFNPVLSSFDPGTGEWRHSTFDGWGIFNNVSFGGIGSYKHYVFVTDQTNPSGIVRFNTDTHGAQRYADGMDYIDLNVGLDNRLYALAYGEELVHVYDPLTMHLMDVINLENYVRGIAINTDGEIFGASWDGSIYRFDSSGAYQASIAAGIGSLSDIDLAPSGKIAVGARDTRVVLTTKSLSSVETFTPATAVGSTFVGFVRERTVIFRNSFESPTSAD